MKRTIQTWLAIGAICATSGCSTLRGPAIPTDPQEAGVALVAASRQGDVRAVTAILDCYPNVVDARSPGESKGSESRYDRWSALHWAAERDDLKLAHILIERGAKANQKPDYNTRTGEADAPVHLVRSATMASLLLNAGADVNLVGWEGLTPLHDARNASIAHLLIAHGANTRATNNWMEAPPLQIAARNGHLDVLRVLLECDKDINGVRGYFGTPLHAAVSYGHLDVTEYLIMHGADLTVRNKDGYKPLEYAILQRLRDNAAVFDLLVQHGDSIDWRGKPDGPDKGWTVLHHVAFFEDCPNTMAFLLKHCKDVNPKNANGQTPLALALDSFKGIDAPRQCESAEGAAERRRTAERIIDMLRKAGATE